jgi:CheY-like chemotaxis protein
MGDDRSEKKVLVVDDEDPILKILEILLRTNGYAPYCASNASDALLTMMEERIRVIFTDLRMPEMDGFCLCRRALMQNPRAKVFAVSAYIGKYREDEFAEAGFAGYFSKPFKSADVVKACDRAFAELAT